MDATENARHLSADELYWAIVQPRPKARGRRRREEIRYLFEEQCPAAVEDLHLVEGRLEDGAAASSAAVVVACPVRQLETWREEPALDRVVPEAAPDWITPDAASNIHLGSLNLLSGVFEGRPARIRRKRRTWITVGLVALATVARVVGAERRVRDDRGQLGARNARGRSIAAELFGPGQTLPLSLQLEAETRRLAAAEAALRELETPVDAGRVLAGLLAAWPEGAEASVSALRVAQREIGLDGAAASANAALELARSLQ